MLELPHPHLTGGSCSLFPHIPSPLRVFPMHPRSKALSIEQEPNKQCNLALCLLKQKKFHESRALLLDVLMQGPEKAQGQANGQVTGLGSGGAVQTDVTEGGHGTATGRWRGQRVSLTERKEEEGAEGEGVGDGDKGTGDWVGVRRGRDVEGQSCKGKGSSSKQDGAACDVHTKVRDVQCAGQSADGHTAVCNTGFLVSWHVLSTIGHCCRPESLTNDSLT